MILSFLICGYYKYLIIIAFILLIHDIGHVITLKMFGYKINFIEILPFGANIQTDISLNSDSKEILVISIAGVIMQILLFVGCFGLYKFNLVSDINYEIFLKYNLFIIIFNMLPIYPLDGYKVITSLLELLISFRFSLLIGYFLSLLFIVLFLFCNYYFDLDNYFIGYFLIYKLISYIREYKFIMNKFYIERYLSDRRYNKINYINSIKKIRKNYLNFINNESEKKVLKSNYGSY